ncbi:glycogen synthase GlgA [Rariglobus hedericola]|uniref:Glycogen synthase n=1 Tax=Rariglobus hedericola TaxID=2597822 RepID=A0A556QNG7_9BACT|nr:glycogen synthase GlgA [Rariglobus hedericola]TSJ78167.1 glycogen synthase GlgA [Rariglobus hedericola]
MKIVQVASELFPYVKTGGLADAVSALAGTLAERGHEVSVFLPGYRAAVDHPLAAGAQRTLGLRIEMGDTFMTGEVRSFSPAPNLTLHLVCREEFFDRRNPYGTPERDYEDNHHRFIFFCKGVVEAMRFMELRADVIHGHDWQCGLLPLLLRHTEQRYGITLAMKTVFTIHNIAFQGVFPMRSFYRTNLPDELMGIDGVEFYGQMSMMKSGILFSDRVTTVSPRYAREIQTAEFGCGLDGVVMTRADDIVGLINGIDTDVWNPATDTLIPANYTVDNLTGKAGCRADLLKRSGFDPKFAGPVFGMVCRLTEQKGVDLVLANAEFFKKNDVRFIVLGSGDKELEAGLRELVAAIPSRVSLSARLDEGMSHLIEAGSDFFLMPSRFEPCGLNQMYSQAYGTIPLVTRVGGLADTVIDLDHNPHAGTGVLFHPSEEGVKAGLDRALTLFADKTSMAVVQARGMHSDFGWDKTAQAYEDLYGDAI